MRTIRKTPIIFGILSLIALFAFAKQEKVIQIFRNGEVIQEYTLDEIDYIEVNERLAVPEQIPDDEIWYVMSNGQVYDVTLVTQVNGNKPFDREVVSNEYYEDHGVIKFDGPVTRINPYTFGIVRGNRNMTAIYLPDCIEYIGRSAFSRCRLTTFRVPKNLQTTENNPFYGSENLSSFIGEHVSDDGRCLILDGCIKAFAPKGITSYITPEGATEIGAYAFFRCDELVSIEINEGITSIAWDAFAESENLKSVTLPESLETVDPYAFRECNAIEGFYGNENFHTPDNQCLIAFQNVDHWNPELTGTWLINFAGKGITEYTIPEGIVAMDHYAFSGKPELESVTLPNSLKSVAGQSFFRCPNIAEVNGPHTTSDHKSIAFDNVLTCFVAIKDITSYHIPAEITKIGDFAFKDSWLEEITMDDNVTEIAGYAFAWCYNLKSLTLSAALKSFTDYNPIIGSNNLESIYMRSPIPPSYSCDQMDEFPNLKIYVPEQTYDLYVNSPQWEAFKQYFVAYHYDDLNIEDYMPDYYYSTDYSQNGTVEILHSATVGEGIDIVLMGDGFSDRQIADGTYRNVMSTMADNLFDEEPYKSFKEMFNVYVVNVVSPTEGYEHGATALECFFGGGTLVGGNDAKCFSYAQKAISSDRMDEALIVVAMNQDTYAGTCYMYYPDNVTGTYGSGASIAYFPTSSDIETFSGLVHHEALGHGFAKLADEYTYEWMGAIPDSEKYNLMQQQNEWGWCKNVDFTADLSAIRWSHFINDERYSAENIGAFEGGLTYWTGVWRPTENSIMRYNTGGFNAPSREAIYYRIHKLAYGDDWTFNYEDFVAYDAVNRSEEALRRANRNHQMPAEPLHAPVIVKTSWREAQSSSNPDRSNRPIAQPSAIPTNTK